MLTPRTDKTLCKNYPPKTSDLSKSGPAISKCRGFRVPIANCIRLVRREDPGDRRRALLTLSAAGRRVYEQIGVSGKAREQQLFAALSPDDQEQLGRTLDTLITTLLAADAA